MFVLAYSSSLIMTDHATFKRTLFGLGAVCSSAGQKQWDAELFTECSSFPSAVCSAFTCIDCPLMLTNTEDLTIHPIPFPLIVNECNVWSELTSFCLFACFSGTFSFDRAGNNTIPFQNINTLPLHHLFMLPFANGQHLQIHYQM